MSPLYAPFLAHIPPGGRILDAGCGSGRDSLYFLRHGYKIDAFDASAKMCRLASNHIGQAVTQKTFKEVSNAAAFDGIWACAALLHETRDSFDAVLDSSVGHSSRVASCSCRSSCVISRRARSV
jgi:2-polyprenyl-3-methyl-5-hydroxy-6-metoxy-1,4-benzoquinol methylase